MINFIQQNFPRNKQDEVYAVLKFLENARVKYRMIHPNISVNCDEPADVIVKDINKRFQVVVGDFFHYQAMGRAKPDSKGFKGIVSMPPRNRPDVWKAVVVDPIIKKSKYGNSAQGTILLIHPPFNYPWIKEDADKLDSSSREKMFGAVGFREIHVVFNGFNVGIYP